MWEVRRIIAVFVSTRVSTGTGERQFVRERQYQMAVSSQEVDNSSAIYSNHLLIVLQLQGITGPQCCKSGDIHSPQWLHSTLH